MTRSMHIGLVGGLDRNGERLSAMAAARGHHLMSHTGRIAGRGQMSLASLVQRSDIVVVQTDINSHAAVRGARELARDYGRPLVLVRRIGITAFAQLLDGLDAKET